MVFQTIRMLGQLQQEHQQRQQEVILNFRLTPQEHIPLVLLLLMRVVKL